MSITLHPTSVNIPLNGYNYFLSTLSDYVEAYPLVVNPYENLTAIPQFVPCSSFPDQSFCKQLSENQKYQNADYWNQVPTENTKDFAHEKKNFDLVNMSNSNNGCNDGNNENKSKIWRPFSPSPPSQDETDVESAVNKRGVRTINRSTFFSIKPSNVKIGLSKTSSFKAVKKNTFTCSYCSSKYISNRQLNSHMRVHTGSKPFRCEYSNCFKSFARNEELTRHKRIHSGFKPHLCTICKKRFGRKDHLSKHLKTHLQTSEKKVYQCTFPGCGHRYTRSDALTRHKSTAHAVKHQK